MPTSGLRSAVPPNHAATRPDLVSAIVAAWQEGKGADSKMNSDFTRGFSLVVAAAQPLIRNAASGMVPTNIRQVLECASPLAILDIVDPTEEKRRRAAAVQDAGALSGRGSQIL